ncbi:MAG: HAD-IA family hydrolase [Patescibacteria group bacterium]|nr:HAD-IA family hydrolase [Patescibacteria group bacterium]
MIKLIIFDCYGLVLNEGYPNTAKVLAKKYGGRWQDYHKIFYYKYFNLAATRKITQKEAWQKAIKHFNLPISWQKARDLHYNLMKLDKRAVKLNQELNKKGYTTLLLSKNTRSQMADVSKKFGLKKVFKNIINTWELNLPKASEETLSLVLRRFKVKPEEVVYIDDQENNLADARKMGIKTILIKNFKNMKKELEKELKIDSNKKLSGVLASPGKAKGKARIIKNIKDRNKVLKNEIVVLLDSDMKLLPTARNKILGFIIEKGNLTCHVATLARESKKPCLVKVKDATKILKDGGRVEVDADKGIVKILK